MSEIKVNNITSYEGSSGPVLSGITTVSSTGFMTLPRGDTAYRGGRGRGIFGGGRTPYVSPNLVNIIDYMTIATLGNALDFGDLYQNTSEFGGCASSTRGVFMGGTIATSPFRINTIEFVTIAQTGNSVDFGDLTLLNSSGFGISNGHGGL